MLLFFNLTALTAMILLIWFKTDAFVSYLKLLGIKKLFYDYDNKVTYFNFSDYLEGELQRITNNTYQRFLLKLLTCPKCFSFWLCFIVFLLGEMLILFPLGYITTLFIYYVICSLSK